MYFLKRYISHYLQNFINLLLLSRMLKYFSSFIIIAMDCKQDNPWKRYISHYSQNFIDVSLTIFMLIFSRASVLFVSTIVGPFCWTLEEIYLSLYLQNFIDLSFLSNTLINYTLYVGHLVLFGRENGHSATLEEIYSSKFHRLITHFLRD